MLVSCYVNYELKLNCDQLPLAIVRWRYVWKFLIPIADLIENDWRAVTFVQRYEWYGVSHLSKVIPF